MRMSTSSVSGIFNDLHMDRSLDVVFHSLIGVKPVWHCTRLPSDSRDGVITGILENPQVISMWNQIRSLLRGVAPERKLQSLVGLHVSIGEVLGVGVAGGLVMVDGLRVRKTSYRKSILTLVILIWQRIER